MGLVSFAVILLSAFSGIFLVCGVIAAFRCLFFLVIKRDKETAKKVFSRIVGIDKYQTIALVVGLVCLYGVSFGFSEKPGALFEKQNYTAHYTGFATLDAYAVNIDYFPVVFRMTVSDGHREVDRLYFQGGFLEVEVEDWDELQDFEELHLTDPYLNDWSAKWVVTVGERCSAKEIENLEQKVLDVDVWTTLLDYQGGLCRVCEEVKTDMKSFLIDGTRVLVCWHCLDTKPTDELRVFVNGEEFFFVPAEW